VDHPLPHVDQFVRPWRTAALVAAAVAGIELLLLVVVGAALVARPESGQPRREATAAKKEAAAKSAAKPAAATPKPEQPSLVRAKVSVLVLNGNGVQGAAATQAARVQRRGYRVRAVANAPRMDFVRSVVMYRAGFAPEALRLARDLGIRMVGPLDGIRSGQLGGAHAVVVVGA
jgi:hypothetical protein